MKTQDFPHALYMLATPIGNLEDLSERAKSILSAVDWIAAEDTRETGKLLHHLGITKDLISLHEHSSRSQVEKLVQKLQAGERGAYASDAGTPGISDPGAALVDEAFKAGIRVVPIPGASALSTILSVTGFSETRSVFHGFLPRDGQQEFWANAKSFSGVHVFFESPHRVEKSLDQLAAMFPDNQLVMGRELTKHFEEIKRGTVTEILARLGAKPESEKRGEFVFALLLEEPKTEDQMSSKDCTKLFEELASFGANQKILLRVGEAMGLKRNDTYRLALEVLGKQKPVKG